MAASPRRLYLIRHAIAAERGPDWPDDGQRPLTKRGAQRMAQVMNGFARLGESIDLILTSPLTRAVQTAAIVADALGRRPPVRVLPALAPGFETSRAAAAMATAARTAHHVALVGHEPDLGQLAAWLIGAREPLPFKKGGICRIDATRWPPGQSNQLVWLATPKMLRR
ncbi:MAG: phosphohistidine phosphatase SixA [Acidobacteriota bacterium]